MSAANVSVVIPTYNCATYIAASIRSALAQSLQPMEILIVDDGSTDDTRAAVLSVGDPRIHYLAVPHQGTAAARNVGIESASGEFIAFLDADDLWRPRMLERQVAVLKRDGDLACSITNFVRFEESSGETLQDQFQYYPELATLPATPAGYGDARIIVGDAFIHLIAFEEIPAYMQCIMFRRAMIGDMRLNRSLRRCQDLEFVARVFMRGKVAFNPEVLTDVRRHSSNITRDISLMNLDKLWALLPLQEAVDTPARRVALNDRLVKGWIDAAATLARTGKVSEGLRHLRSAFGYPGSNLRKLKGLARFGYELGSSLVSGSAHSGATN